MYRFGVLRLFCIYVFYAVFLLFCCHTVNRIISIISNGYTEDQALILDICTLLIFVWAAGTHHQHWSLVACNKRSGRIFATENVTQQCSRRFMTEDWQPTCDIKSMILHKEDSVNHSEEAMERTPVMRLRGGGQGKRPMVSPCSCGGACNHTPNSEDDYDEDMEWEVASDDEYDDKNTSLTDIESSEDTDNEEIEETDRCCEEDGFDDDRRETDSEENDYTFCDDSFDSDRREFDDAADQSLESPKTSKPSISPAKKKPKEQRTAGRLKTQKMSWWNIEKELARKRCCKKNCLHDVLTNEEIFRTRSNFQEKSREDQIQWLMNFFEITSRVRKGKACHDYHVEGKEICQKAWIFCQGMAYGRFHYWKNAFTKRGEKCAIHARTGLIIKSKRMIEAELWFEDFVNSLANRMPDTNRKELPSCFTINKIFKTYCEAMKSNVHKAFGITQFRRMWKLSFPEVVIPKRNRFTKCGVCLLITEHIRATKNKENRMSWTKRKQLHMEQQAGERKKYYKHQKKAIARPDKYMSIIIDGMDQSKTHLPHWLQASKLEGDYDRFLKTHVTGVLSHGHDLAMCFLDLLRWPQDSNPTMNYLMSCFRHLTQIGHPLPPTLYLQLDNCYRDCKNIYILGFCSLLVKAGVFKKVRLSYLMVGHTHEDIDQMFSRISFALSKSKAVTLNCLQSVIQGAFSPIPVTCYVENIYDLKSWLRPYIATFQHHSHPHAFRFKLNGHGEVEMTYRKWAKSERKQWLPFAEPFISLRQIPPEHPSILQPDLKKCPSIETMEEAVKKLQLRMTAEERDWWEETLVVEKKKVEIWNSLSKEAYFQAGKSFDLLDMKFTVPKPEPEPNEDEYQRREKDLVQLIEKKENHKPVKIVKQARLDGETKNKPKPKKRKTKK